MNTASTTSQSGLAAPTSADDPVCGMNVQADKAAARLELDGKLYLFCSTDCQHKFETDPKKYIGTAATATPVPDATGAPISALAPTGSDHGMPMQAALRRGQQSQAKDPICGMMVDKASALRSERGGRSYYFCSVGCQRTFESPEQELKLMSTRVAIAPMIAAAAMVLSPFSVIIISALLKRTKLGHDAVP